MAKQSSTSYDPSQIKVLKGLESVRQNVGMYVGDSDKKGLHHLVWEVVDNSVDEAMAGHCNEINVVIEKDGSTISVQDNGRGIPVGEHPEEKVSALQVVLTQLHAGGKFEAGAYTASGGLHGVGLSCVNALSSLLRAEVIRDGGLWSQEYVRGNPQYKVRKDRGLKKGEKTGTKITWIADTEIFKNGIELSEKMLVGRLQEIAFLNTGLKITFDNKKTGTREGWQYNGGLNDYLKHLMVGKDCYPPEPIHGEDSADLTSRDGKCVVQISLSYSKEDDGETLLGFTNNICQPDGGTHITGFKTALTRAVNQMAKTNGLLKDNEENLEGKDTLDGLTAIISIRFPRPEFTGQTKSKLGSAEARTIVETITYELLTSYFEKNAGTLKEIVHRAKVAAAARKAAKKQSELIKRKGLLGRSNRMPGKLSDCNTNNREESELFIVEGDSAAGCFSGDTKVALIDGRNLSFSELFEEQMLGKNHFCYTVLDDGAIGVGKIVNVRITKRSNRWLKVTLDNGEVIENTLEHEYMLSNGNYVPACSLKNNDSLQPLYRKLSSIKQPGITINNYEMLWQPVERRWVFTHVLSDNYNLACNYYSKSDGDTRHHIDFDKLNNNPTNLIRMWKKDHMQLHRELASLTLHTPEAKEKAAAAKRTPEFRLQRQQKMDHYNRIVDGFRRVFEENPPKVSRSKQSPIRISNSAAYRRFDRFAKKFFDGNKFQAYDAIRFCKHRVVSVEVVENEEEKEFWELEVEEHAGCTKHNFALAAGVFVHNSGKDGRNPETQAILPIRGKIINAEKRDIVTLLKNKEIQALITAIGTGVRDEFDIDKLRYHKIIIMSDADDDGHHISTLLLTFFYRYMRPLVAGGHLYLAQPPLYCVEHGKKRDYCFNDAELKKIMSDGTKVKVVRFKGLGEMDAEQLAETTMDPANRHLIQLNLDDVAGAERIVAVLMGSDVPARKAHITAQVNKGVN